MNGATLIIFIAIDVAVVAWLTTRVIARLLDRRERRIKQRLSLDAPTSGGPTGASSIQREEPRDLKGLLARFGPVVSLHRAVVQAWPDMTVPKFLGVMAGAGLVMFVLTYFMTASTAVAVVSAGLGAYLPVLLLINKRTSRQRVLADQLPDALDFLARVLRAGHSFSTALQMMGEELPRPLGGEFKRAYEQHSLGQNLDDALRGMIPRVDSTDFAFFVTAALIQRQTGGDLAEVLDNISGMIRQRIRLQQHVKAKTAEGRLTGYVLVAFPAVMFVIISMLDPTHTEKLTSTWSGQKMLVLALALQALGLWSIKKLTTVRV